jgi:rhamnose transport system permease protein
MTFGVFVLMGALAGLGGAMYVARFATVNPADAGLGFELAVISAVVIGGTNIFGGSGTVIGTVLGTMLVGILSNGLTVVGVSGFWQRFASGAIILIAIIADSFVRKRIERRQSNQTMARVR